MRTNTNNIRFKRAGGGRQTTTRPSGNGLRVAWTPRLMALALTLAIFGCAPTPNRKSPLLITGVDASGSFRGQLGGAAYIISRLASPTLCGSWEMLRVDQAVTECYNAAPPAGSAAATSTVVDAVKAVPARNTYPAVFWKRAAADAADAKTSTAILLASDGDNDDQTAVAADSIRRSVAALAHNPKVKLVAIYGVNKENRGWLRAAFKPLGDRFVLSGLVKPADVQDLKTRLLALH